jgi:hypothetical protein
MNSPQVRWYLRTNTSCPIVDLLTTGISVLHTQRRTALSNQDNAVCNLNSEATLTLTVAVPQLLQSKQLPKRHKTWHKLSGDTADRPYTDLPVASHSDAYRITCINPPMENPTVMRVCDERRKARDANGAMMTENSKGAVGNAVNSLPKGIFPCIAEDKRWQGILGACRRL